jgi:hypothetical protein
MALTLRTLINFIKVIGNKELFTSYQNGGSVTSNCWLNNRYFQTMPVFRIPCGLRAHIGLL